MKASYYELRGPRDLHLRENELSDTLPPGELLARTEFSAVSAGTELAAWLGKPPLRPSQAYPRLIGYSNVAEVIAVGEGTGGIQIGDSVLTHQSHRTAFRCGVNEVLLSLRGASEPDRRTLAVSYFYHLGYAALLRAGYTPGHAVAIVGFGALGLATTQLVRAFGGWPVVFSGRPETARTVLQADVTVLAKTRPEAGDLTALTDMDGVDTVINTSDRWEDFLLSQQAARTGGTVVCLGFPGRGLPPPAFNPLDSQYFYDKQLSIHHCGHMPLEGSPSDVRFTLKRNLQYLFGLLRAGRLDAQPFIALEARFDELASLYDRFSKPVRPGYSALLRWRD